MRRVVTAFALTCSLIVLVAFLGSASSADPDLDLTLTSIDVVSGAHYLPPYDARCEACAGRADDVCSEALPSSSGSSVPSEQPSPSLPQVFPGRVLQITATVKNAGTEPADACRIRFSWRRHDAQTDCGFVAEELGALDPRENRSVVAEMDTTGLAPGCYAVSVWADAESTVHESDETNNRSSFCVRICTPRPNLHPRSLRIEPASPIEQGETLVLRAEILNTGQATAGPFAVLFLAAPAHSAREVCADTPIGLDGDGGDGEPWARIGSVSIEGLARDDARDVTVSFDTGLLAGGNTTYVVQALVDPHVATTAGEPDDRGPHAQVYEANENDNCIASSFTLVENVKRRPELKPISLELSPPSPLAWKAVADAAVTIVNTGGSPTQTESVVLFFYRAQGDSDADWKQLETYEATLADSEASRKISITVPKNLDIEQGRNSVTRRLRLRFDLAYDISPGNYELKVVVDHGNAEPEQDDENNALVIGFSVLGSELHPLGLDVASAPIRQGDNVAVSVEVVNTGEKQVEDCTVGFFVDGEHKDTFYYSTAAGLAKDDAVVARGYVDTTDLAVGKHVLRAVVDPDDRIAEVDESNNAISVPFTINPPSERKAELQVERVSTGTELGTSQADASLIQATVINRGNLAAAGVAVDLLACRSCAPCLSEAANSDPDIPTCGIQAVLTENAPICILGSTYWIERLEPGERHVVSWYVTSALPADSSICVTIDRSDQIEEMDERNNTLVLGYVAAPPSLLLPNLVCQLSVSPSTNVGVGDPVRIDGSVSNQGSQPAGSFRVRLELRDPLGNVLSLGDQEIDGLNAGETQSLTAKTVQLSLPMGTYEIAAAVDWRNEVEEGNEGDNECRVTVHTTGVVIPPDLVPISIRFSPPCAPPCRPYSAQVVAGEKLLAYVTVQNQGALAAGRFAVSFSTVQGTERKSWPGLAPLEQAEIAYELDTSSPGDFTLTVVVDPENLIDETPAGEANNAAVASYQIEAPEVVAAEKIVQGMSPVRYLALDGTTHTLYAVWQEGEVRAISPDGSSHLLFDAAEVITASAAETTARSVAFIGTSSGQVHAIDLVSGNVGTISLLPPGEVRTLEAGGSGTMYAATSTTLFSIDQELVITGQTNVSGALIDVRYDEQRETVYVITASGLYAYDSQLGLLCETTRFLGSPTALAVGPGGVYVGTDAGVVYAHSFCMAHSGVPYPMIVEGWRYPRFGQLSGAVRAITVDARGLDPIYVATDAGKLHALSYTGALLWTYPAADGQFVAPIHSTPVVEGRSGRVFFGDDGGVPHVLGTDGQTAFDADISQTNGEAIRSSLAIDETRQQTEAGTRLIRTYYYGAEDGWVYKIDSQR